MILQKRWQRSIPKLFLRGPLTVNNQGWTLIEIGVVAVIVGILASMAIPSMTGMMGRNKLQATSNRVKAVFQEAQRAAIKNGSSCTVTITPTGVAGTDPYTENTIKSPGGCITDPITSKDTIDNAIRITNPTTQTTVQFSYKGNPSNSSDLIIVLDSPTKTPDIRCIVISAGIGIMRSGIYDGTNCNASF